MSTCTLVSASPLSSYPLMPPSPATPPAVPISRRNSSGRRLSGGIKAADLADLENDDENERQEAAQKAEQQRLDRLRSPLKETPGHKRRVEEYGEAMKMVMDNKVTTKNAWKVNLIDDMDRMIAQHDGDASEIDFQKHATTLEAGAKIFSLRVDSLETQQAVLRRRLDGCDVPDEIEEEEAGKDGKDRPVDLSGAPEWFAAMETSEQERVVRFVFDADKDAKPTALKAELSEEFDVSEAKAAEIFDFLKAQVRRSPPCQLSCRPNGHLNCQLRRVPEQAAREPAERLPE